MCLLLAARSAAFLRAMHVISACHNHNQEQPYIILYLYDYVNTISAYPYSAGLHRANSSNLLLPASFFCCAIAQILTFGLHNTIRADPRRKLYGGNTME